MSDTAATGWARAYRPLRRRGLIVQLLLLVLAEYGLFASYRAQDADFHWATHFLVGLTAAAVLHLAWLVVTAAPGRGVLISVLGAHLFAMFPDVLFRLGVPHAGWMNVFLGHIWVHHLPGGDVSWLVIALLACGAYSTCLALWIRARTQEARQGLAPGVGIGGIGLIAAQGSPDRVPLAHVRYGPEGPADIVLLHGLGASHLIWEPAGAQLGRDGDRALAPDLLGFGASRRIGTRFELADHVAALLHLLDITETRGAVVAGHSFGCAVAVAFAAAHPACVTRLVLVAPPAFRDPAMARARLAQEGWMARQVINGSPAARPACSLMCLLRPTGMRIAARVALRIPAEVVRDGVRHSWPAYRDAVATMLDANPIVHALEHPSHPTTVVLADIDRRTPTRDVLDHPHDAVQVIVLPGDHLFVYEDGEAIADAIAATDRSRGEPHDRH